MNLTSIHLADLIEVLHGVLAPQPVVLRGASRRVVAYEGRVFALRDAPVSVEGPFASAAELVEALGVRRQDGAWVWDERAWRMDGPEGSVTLLDGG